MLLPLWAILYSGLILASAAGTIMISGRRSPVYILSELLSGLFAVGFFLIHYSVIAYPRDILIPIAMIGFILYQEVWVNKELYSFLQLDDIPKEERGFVMGITAIMIGLFLAPLFWVIFSVLGHY